MSAHTYVYYTGGKGVIILEEDLFDNMVMIQDNEANRDRVTIIAQLGLGFNGLDFGRQINPIGHFPLYEWVGPKENNILKLQKGEII